MTASLQAGKRSIVSLKLEKSVQLLLTGASGYVQPTCQTPTSSFTCESNNLTLYPAGNPTCIAVTGNHGYIEFTESN